MDLSTQKEQFSLAYVKSLAASVGLNYSIPQVDDDSIDITILGKGYDGIVRNPSIDLQLKCTATDCIDGDNLKLSLKIKNYHDLRGGNLVSPRYLLVLKVPDEVDNWLVHGEDWISLHNSCYWLSLRELPDVSNSTNVTVEIPVNQRLTREALCQLMENASQRNFA